MWNALVCDNTGQGRANQCKVILLKTKKDSGQAAMTVKRIAQLRLKIKMEKKNKGSVDR